MPGQVLISELSSCQISTRLACVANLVAVMCFLAGNTSIALGVILEPHKTVLGTLLLRRIQ